ncbi:MAG: hypothetical protein IPN17_22980, partial [Deltaproteobacteria bacterium]|nr:hypothetical protein [Deltaproteobacteria bacterium]
MTHEKPRLPVSDNGAWIARFIVGEVIAAYSRSAGSTALVAQLPDGRAEQALRLDPRRRFAPRAGFSILARTHAAQALLDALVRAVDS